MPPRKKRQNEYYACSDSSLQRRLYLFINSISNSVNNNFAEDFFFGVDITLHAVNPPLNKENLAKKSHTALHAIIAYTPDTVQDTHPVRHINDLIILLLNNQNI